MDETAKQPPLSFWLSGVGLLICVGGWTWLSRQFIFGQGHVNRPIPAFLLLFAAAWLCFLFAVREVRKATGAGPLLFILAIGIAARFLLIPSELIQENDVYRYVLDGQVVLHGGNPYELSPWERLHQKGDPGLNLGSEAARVVSSRISYPQIPTVYPPLAEAAFAVGALIGGWQWKGQRAIFLLVDLLTLLTLLPVLDVLALRREWVVLYAWNPLLLKEVANSSHLDILVAFCLLGMFLCLARFERTQEPGGSKQGQPRGQGGRGHSLERGQRRRVREYGYLLLIGCALGGAILSKLYPVLLLPAVFFFMWRRWGRLKDAAIVSALAIVTALAGYAPFAGIGLPTLFRGLRIYASDWRMNEGFFTLLALLFDRPRLWATAICGVTALLLPCLRPASNLRELAGQAQWVILVWFLVMPSPFPWYGLPLILLMVVSESRPANAATLVLSGVGALYYLRFYVEYHNLNPSWWQLIRLLEHASIWIAMGAAAWGERRLAREKWRSANGD